MQTLINTQIHHLLQPRLVDRLFASTVDELRVLLEVLGVRRFIMSRRASISAVPSSVRVALSSESILISLEDILVLKVVANLHVYLLNRRWMCFVFCRVF